MEPNWNRIHPNILTTIPHHLDMALANFSVDDDLTLFDGPPTLHQGDLGDMEGLIRKAAARMQISLLYRRQLNDCSSAMASTFVQGLSYELVSMIS